MLPSGSSNIIGPSLLIPNSVTILLAVFVIWGIKDHLNNKEIERKREEEERLKKYREYLESKKEKIQTEIKIQRQILIDNGWTINTAVCTAIFTLFHWPCATTVLTIKKETGSFKWTILGIIFPTVFGFTICAIITLIFKIIC